MKRVEEIASGALAPGMVVAEAVVDDSGRMLIPGGAVLTENTIASLVRREIPSVKVEKDVAEDPAERESHLHALLERLDHLFRHAGDSDLMRSFRQAIVDYRMEQRS